MSSRFHSHDASPLGSKQKSFAKALDYNEHKYTDPADFVVTEFDLDIDFVSALDSRLRVRGRHKMSEPIDYEGGYGRFDTPNPGLLKRRGGLEYEKIFVLMVWTGQYYLSTPYYLSTIFPSTVYPGWLEFVIEARGYTGHTLFNDFAPFGYTNAGQTDTPITCAIKLSYATKSGLAYSAETEIDTLWTCTYNISGTATLAP